jgi:hypothetical protein
MGRFEAAMLISASTYLRRIVAHDEDTLSGPVLSAFLAGVGTYFFSWIPFRPSRKGLATVQVPAFGLGGADQNWRRSIDCVLGGEMIGPDRVTRLEVYKAIGFQRPESAQGAVEEVMVAIFSLITGGQIRNISRWQFFRWDDLPARLPPDLEKSVGSARNIWRAKSAVAALRSARGVRNYDFHPHGVTIHGVVPGNELHIQHVYLETEGIYVAQMTLRLPQGLKKQESLVDPGFLDHLVDQIVAAPSPTGTIGR